jgi:hypothetical protein
MPAEASGLTGAGCPACTLAFANASCDFRSPLAPAGRRRRAWRQQFTPTPPDRTGLHRTHPVMSLACRAACAKAHAPGAAASNKAASSPIATALLQPPHLRVAPIALQQLGVRAALNDAARLQHHDLVGVDHGTQAVRDDQRGFAL